MRGVAKAYGDNQVLIDVNLDVFEGETLAIIGESGCGKSTVLKAFAGLVNPDEGEVYFRSQALGEMDWEELQRMRQRVSLVFQENALFDSMDVLANVSYALAERTSMDDDTMEARALEVLKLVGMGPDVYPGILDTMPQDLSGGMKKRVAVARGIAAEPEVILYDDPTQGLDPSTCNRIAHMIEHLQDTTGCTTVVVSHDLPTVWHVADRVAMLHEGRFVITETTEVFRALDDPLVREFIGDPVPSLFARAPGETSSPGRTPIV
jgi:phospholipid/cholesterol/gamma-HCH transport system ATP-binding protein